MLKKLIAVAAFGLIGAAHADTGPIYVSYPGFCNVKEIYINPNGDIYGYERGCSTFLGSPLFGTVDGASGNVYISTTEAGGEVCMHAYRSDWTLLGGCTNGRQYRYGQTITYGISTFLPRSIKDPAGKELPSINK